MVGLYKDPKGNNIFRKSSTVSPVTVSAEVEVTALKQRIKQLEDQVKEKEVRITILPSTYIVQR